MSPKHVNKLEGKLVVIIGGTSGIGFAVAEACVEYGANVVVASRKKENIDKTINTLQASYPEASGRVRGHPCNLTADDPEPEIAKLFEYATNGGATKVDHVVDTAGEGGAAGSDLQSATSESIMKTEKTRFVGVTLLAKITQQYAKPASSSSLTITTGVLAHRPYKGIAVGIAATGQKEFLARGLAVDMAPVRVNVVSPGAILTPMLQAGMQAMGGAEVAGPMFRKMSLLNEIGTPEDCAEAYLCSIRSNFMTGAVLHVEGGTLLQSS